MPYSIALFEWCLDLCFTFFVGVYGVYVVVWVSVDGVCVGVYDVYVVVWVGVLQCLCCCLCCCLGLCFTEFVLVFTVYMLLFGLVFYRVCVVFTVYMLLFGLVFYSVCVGVCYVFVCVYGCLS